jgi:glycosyltransferase involved in cell wall biosynthesis
MTIRQQKTDEISVGFLSYEFPPKIYGGVGVHVGELTRHLAESIRQVHVFTSHVEGLDCQKAGNVFVHRSSKPVVPGSNHSCKMFEKVLTNFNVPGMMEKHLSNDKLDLLDPQGELIQRAATVVKNDTELPLVMTAHSTYSTGINMPKPDRLDVFIKQNVVDKLDRFNVESRYMQRELNQAFGITPHVEGLDGQKAGSVYVQKSSKPIVPASNYSSKEFKRVMTNLNVAGMVEKHLSNAELDLLHSHGGLIQLAATEAKNDTGLPLVMTAHSTEINRLSPDKLSVVMEHNVADKVDRFIAVSKYMRKELNQTFGINYNKITVIPNGVDTAIFKHQEADDIRRKYRLDNRFVVLFVGRDDPQKGVRYLVNAVKNLAKQIPEIMLVMVGHQDIYNDEHILCLPRVSRSELVKIHSLSDVFVLPSVYEPFGIVLLEAMACETPCIGIRTGGMPDIIDHNRTGLLVEPRNDEGLSEAIARLYHDPEKMYKMGKKGREKVISDFNWKDISAKTIGVYRQVLN